MRVFECSNFNQEQPALIILTEEEILAGQNYWDYWTTRMNKIGKTHLINKDNCLLDWCTTNWAREVTNSE